MSNTQVLAAHRDRVIERLTLEFAGDRIEVEELDRRVGLAHTAETPAALDALVTDLDSAEAGSVAAGTVGASVALVPAKRLRVVFGSVERVGAWAVPPQLAARVVCGSLVLDLRDARLGAGVTTIDVHVTMGQVEILVPPGIAVDVDARPTFGSIEDRTTPGTATNLVRITGRVAFGNVEVTTLLRGETKREARWRRRRERRFRRRMWHTRHAPGDSRWW